MFGFNFTKAIITKAPTGRFIFVGRVPAALASGVYDTLDEAKIAAIDAMIACGETFPIDVQSID